MVVKVELFKTEHCVFCPEASRVLSKVTKEFGSKVDYQELYVDKDQRTLSRAQQLGISAVPVILINGLPRFTGVPRETMVKMMIEQAIKEEVKD